MTQIETLTGINKRLEHANKMLDEMKNAGVADSLEEYSRELAFFDDAIGKLADVEWYGVG